MSELRITIPPTIEEKLGKLVERGLFETKDDALMFAFSKYMAQRDEKRSGLPSDYSMFDEPDPDPSKEEIEKLAELLGYEIP